MIGHFWASFQQKITFVGLLVDMVVFVIWINNCFLESRGKIESKAIENYFAYFCVKMHGVSVCKSGIIIYF